MLCESKLKMKILLTIAWRNLWRNKVRSLVIILSVITGIWAGTVIMSIYYGMMQSKLATTITEETSHIQIHNSAFDIEDEEWKVIDGTEKIKTILQNDQAVKAFAMRLNVTAMIANARGSNGIKISGIDATDENQLTGLKNRITEGEYFTAEKQNRILVGKALADKMKLKVKSKVVITFQDKENNLVSGAFRIAGIYSATSSIQEEYNAFVLADDIRSLVQMRDSVNEIAVLLQKDEAIEPVIQNLKNNFPQLKIESWREVAPETGLIEETSDIAALIIVGIILLALTFGIINTMLMAILERTREIGMMIALGMNRIRVFFLVVTETVFLVLTGVPFGFLLAYSFITWFGKHGIDLTAISGKALARFGYSNVIYTDLPINSYLQVLLLVSVAAILSSILPALKALKLNPAQTIKI